MTDIALHFDPVSGPDIRLIDGALQLDEGLHTAIVISLFSDARAPIGAELPHDDADRRGWWGDDFASDQTMVGRGPIGSLLWLLARDKVTAETLNRAREAATEALLWLVKDQIAAALRVTVERQGLSRIALSIALDRPAGPARARYDFLWEASA